MLKFIDEIKSVKKEFKSTKNRRKKKKRKRKRVLIKRKHILFEFGQNVMCLRPDKSGVFFPGQVFGVNNSLYDIYFPQDGKVLRKVTKKMLSLPKQHSKWSKINRQQFLTMGAFDHNTHVKGTPMKTGRFEPMDMGTGKNVNKYVCFDKKKYHDDTKYLFDMGYVQKILLKECFPFEDCSEIYS